MSKDIIKIIPGEKENGDKHFTLLNGRWRCVEYEIQDAEKSAVKDKVRKKARGTL